MPPLPRSWTCSTHGDPTEYGCIRCDRIQGELGAMLLSRKGLTALRCHAAELVLRYAANDHTRCVSEREVARSWRVLSKAAKSHVAELRRAESDRAAVVGMATSRRRRAA